MGKTSPIRSKFFILRVYMTFWYNLSRDLGFFSVCELKNLGFRQKSFQQFFSEMHWRCGRQHSCFLLILQFFSRNLSVFCQSFGKKSPAVFSKQLNTCAEDYFGIFSLFFHFSLLSRKLPNCEQNFTNEILSFSFFCVEKTFGTSFRKTLRFFGLWDQKSQSLPKNVSAVFLKRNSRYAEKRSSCFFSSKNIIFLGPRIYVSRSLKWKFLASILKVRNTCKKEQLDSFLQKNHFFLHVLRAGNFQILNEILAQKSAFVIFRVQKSFLYIFFSKISVVFSDCEPKHSGLKHSGFLSLYFEQETFTLWVKLLREKSQFLIFRVQRAFWPVFLRDTRFFRKVSLKLQASEEKFKQCFQKCHQDVEKNVRVLFGNSSFFLGIWAFFLEDWAENFRQFFQHGKIRVQNIVLVIFPKQFFFSFVLWAENFHTLRKTSPKNPQFFLFRVQRTFGTFRPRECFLSDCVNKYSGIDKNFSAVFLKMNSGCAEKRSCFWSKKYFFLDFEQAFLAIWIKKSWHGSQGLENVLRVTSW